MEARRMFVFLGVGCALLVAPVLTQAPAQAAQCAIDFEGLPVGTIFTDLSVGAGISGCDIDDSVWVESENCMFSNEAAIVFDSTCTPTPISICETYDQDIGTPHWDDWGGPGIGDGGCWDCPFPNGPLTLGNIAVLAKDKRDNFNNITYAPGSDGLVDDPDDADCNGRYVFDFTDIRRKGVTMDKVTVLDIEFDEGESPAMIKLKRFGEDSTTFYVVDTGNGGRTSIDLIGIENVTEMEVEFKGSGALAGVFFDAPELQRACWATFGGFNNAYIGPEGAKVASFGGNVGPPPSGHLNIVHHDFDQHLKVPDVEVVRCERIEANCPNSGGPGQPGGKKGFDVNTLTFAGIGTLDGTPVDVYGQIIDCGEPQGKKNVDPDQFWVQLDGTGMWLEGILDGGNAQLHPPVGPPQ